jgi:hypothetical protein
VCIYISSKNKRLLNFVVYNDEEEKMCLLIHIVDGEEVSIKIIKWKKKKHEEELKAITTYNVWGEVYMHNYV